MNAESILQLANELPDDVDERNAIYRAAKELMLRAESPRDTVFRVFWMNGAVAAAVVAVELGIFKTLAENPNRIFSVQELSAKNEADPKLVIRLLKTLAAFKCVAQIAPDGFQATNNTISLTTPFAEQVSQVQTQFIGRMMLELPSYLKRTGYKNPSDTSSTAFHQAYNTDKDLFEWFAQPENKHWSDKLMSFMAVQRYGQDPWMTRPQFLRGFDIALSQEDIQQGRAQFVDIGGAVGHQCIAFRQNYPELKGPVILQDLSFVADLARKDPRTAQLDITVQNHDFLTQQTLEGRGAKIYYMRNVLHDWNDDKDAVILKHIRDAMADDSLLIVDEAIIPDKDVEIIVAAADMVMMAMPAAQERSEGMWRDLVERQVGLKIRDIKTYDLSTQDSLIFISKT